jgi:hypothetical protein
VTGGTFTVPAGGTAFGSATCPTGQVAIGGGPVAVSGSSNADLITSYPGEVTAGGPKSRWWVKLYQVLTDPSEASTYRVKVICAPSAAPTANYSG